MIEKPEELFIGYVAQKAVIAVNSKILFVKSVSGNAKWDLPGGRLHINETPEEGLQRELREELSLECRIGNVITTKHLSPTRILFHFILWLLRPKLLVAAKMLRYPLMNYLLMFG